MLRANDTKDLIPRLEAIVVALEKAVLPKRNGRGVVFRSEKLSPLVKELAQVVKLGIDAGVFEPDVVTLEFYEQFGTSTGLVYQTSASGRNDDIWEFGPAVCPHCQGDLIKFQSQATGDVRAINPETL